LTLPNKFAAAPAASTAAAVVLVALSVMPYLDSDEGEGDKLSTFRLLTLPLLLLLPLLCAGFPLCAFLL
jgi:hypothetical protein